jgi:hypothetical protein
MLDVSHGREHTTREHGQYGVSDQPLVEMSIGRRVSMKRSAHVILDGHVYPKSPKLDQRMAHMLRPHEVLGA